MIETIKNLFVGHYTKWEVFKISTYENEKSIIFSLTEVREGILSGKKSFKTTRILEIDSKDKDFYKDMFSELKKIEELKFRKN